MNILRLKCPQDNPTKEHVPGGYQNQEDLREYQECDEVEHIPQVS